MGEYVFTGKAGEVEPHPVGQKAKTRSGQRLTALARQHGVEPLPQCVQVKYVGRRVGQLRIGETGSAPIGQLPPQIAKLVSK